MNEIDKLVNFDNFLMIVDQKLYISRRGAVITGHIEKGEVHVNDKVILVCDNGNKEAVVNGIEMFRKSFESAKEGDNLGLIFNNLNREDIEECTAIIKDDNIKWYKN